MRRLTRRSSVTISLIVQLVKFCCRRDSEKEGKRNEDLAEERRVSVKAEYWCWKSVSEEICGRKIGEFLVKDASTVAENWW